MALILVIARRELHRLGGRFRGRSRPIVLGLLGVTLLLSVLAFRDGPNLGQGLYHVGVSPDGPALTDRRFVLHTVDRASAHTLLNTLVLDAYVDAQTVLARLDPKSQYALGAVRRYLEQQELVRLSEQYDLADAFPLRVEVNYLTSTVGSEIGFDPGTLSSLLDVAAADVAPVSAGDPAAATDDAVREQLQAATDPLPDVQFDPAEDKAIIIPSLLTPPLPFAQVLLAFIYIMPVSFVSVFFVSSFMEEKTNRRLTILLSAPVRPVHIILGKMLPYAAFALGAISVVALISRANLLLALAILSPVVLFVFAIYLMVPLLYRTFKDTTFISMLATALTTTYLIFPAVFSGVNDLAYISPLTLVVKMYRGEAFGLREYLFSTVPMAAVFGLSLYAATRTLNEEYLSGYTSLYRKLADAIFLMLNRRRPYLSIFFLSLLFVPLIYMIQLALLAMSTNLPLQFALIGMLIVAALVEEIAKSIGIVALTERGVIRSVPRLLALSGLSAAGFLIGEKALLAISVSVVAESALSAAMFNSGAILVPFAAHFVFTSSVCVLRGRFRWRYWLAVLAGAAVHVAYNWIVAGGLV